MTEKIASSKIASSKRYTGVIQRSLKTGTQVGPGRYPSTQRWIPASAGMTVRAILAG
jgi:hypothetical protein